MQIIGNSLDSKDDSPHAAGEPAIGFGIDGGGHALENQKTTSQNSSVVYDRVNQRADDGRI